MNKKKKMIICFVLGMVGCLCFGGGDWLMVYGNTAHTGELYWLTQGIIGISPVRNAIAMALAFPVLSATQNAKSGKPRDKAKLSGINQHKADCYAVCCVSQVVYPAQC